MFGSKVVFNNLLHLSTYSFVQIFCFNMDTTNTHEQVMKIQQKVFDESQNLMSQYYNQTKCLAIK